MKWFMKMNDEEFAYMNECSADIVFSVEHDLDNEDEEKSIIYVDELIDYAIETGPTRPVGGMGSVLEVLSRLK